MMQRRPAHAHVRVVSLTLTSGATSAYPLVLEIGVSRPADRASAEPAISNDWRVARGQCPSETDGLASQKDRASCRRALYIYHINYCPQWLSGCRVDVTRGISHTQRGAQRCANEFSPRATTHAQPCLAAARARARTASPTRDTVRTASHERERGARSESSARQSARAEALLGARGPAYGPTRRERERERGREGEGHAKDPRRRAQGTRRRGVGAWKPPAEGCGGAESARGSLRRKAAAGGRRVEGSGGRLRRSVGAWKPPAEG